MSGSNITVCPACCTWHGAPNPCAYNCTAPCPSCKFPRGLLTAEMDPAGPCSFCLRGEVHSPPRETRKSWPVEDFGA